jgi:hypothetical protein
MKRTEIDTRDEYEGRDRKRDRNGWKAQLKTARRAKAQRKSYEDGASRKGWK